MGKKERSDETTKPASGGNSVYSLGMIGACVYYWQRADTTEGRVLGLLKGLVWPAFLVYEVFSAVSGRPASRQPAE